ncbi:MAG: DASS family sodium-coupled anion symporter [Gemmatimonadales bacterium]|nr:DASS family sodium-coupled anion symporter [Gemmatimonadales bacterium]
MTATDNPPRRTFRLLALLAGPLLYLLVLRLAPGGLGPDQREVLGVGGWMLLWWLLEPVPLAATALLPVILLPLNGVLSMRDVTAPYANEMILLFLAGFLIAAALERWNAHTRLALGVVRHAGRGGRGIVLAFMVATALVSLFVSNTATAAMMFPIAMAIGQLFGEGAPADRVRTSLFLGLAYAASIGGMGTLLGTPPNLIFAAAAPGLAGEEVDFVRFLAVGLPCVLLLLPLAWLLLVRVLFPSDASLETGAATTLDERRAALGPLRGGELATMVVFGLAALAWMVRQPKELAGLRLPGLQDALPGLSEAGIGLAAALLLFALQARDEHGARRPLLTWREARGIPWDVLLLFGGGLSLAAAMESSDLTTWLGDRLRALEGLPTVGIYGVVALATVLLSELASNTAVAAVAMPATAALARATDLSPLSLMAVAALAASAGFALPIATPPNAIVFGSGRVRSRDMLVAGLLLDLLAVVVIVAVVLLGGFGA